MKKLCYLFCLSVVIFILSGCQKGSYDDSTAYTSGLKFEYVKETGSYMVTGYEGTEPWVVIPGIYKHKRVTSIKPEAFVGNEVMTSIYVTRNITKIGDDAFKNCNNMVKATLPYVSGGVETQVEDAHFWRNPFGLSLHLKELVLLNSCTTIPDYAFWWFSLLEKVTLPSTLISIGESAFWSCENLKEINFEDCTSLQTIGQMAFDGCKNLTKIDLSETLLTKIKDKTFGLCYAMTSLKLPRGVTEIGTEAFSAMNLRDLNLSDCNSLVNINSKAFCNWSHLTSLVLPRSIKYIAQDAFYGCNRLVEIYNLSPYRFDSLKGQIPVTFHTSLAEPSIIQNVDGFLIAPYGQNNPYCIIDYIGEETEIKIPELATGIGMEGLSGSMKIRKVDFSNCPDLFYIGDKAFWYSDVTELIIPASVTEIGQGAFSNCMLKTLDLSACTSVDSITGICSYDYSLSKVILPGSIKEIGSASFMYCVVLKAIDFEGTLQQWGQVELNKYNWNVNSEITTIHCLDGDITCYVY